MLVEDWRFYIIPAIVGYLLVAVPTILLWELLRWIIS